MCVSTGAHSYSTQHQRGSGHLYEGESQVQSQRERHCVEVRLDFYLCHHLLFLLREDGETVISVSGETHLFGQVNRDQTISHSVFSIICLGYLIIHPSVYQMFLSFCGQ